MDMIAKRHVLAAVIAAAGAVTVLACSGGGTSANRGASADSAAAASGSAAQTAPATPAESAGKTAPAGAAAPATGQTVKVRMIGDAKGYREDPYNVTVKVGDAVQWINVSGGPHNVSFWPDSVPAASQTQLDANMPNQSGSGPAQKLGTLTGPLLVAANDTYTVSFAGVKPGVYKYFCTPHVATGMRGTVTVQ